MESNQPPKAANMDIDSNEVQERGRPLTPRSPSSSFPKPKGILKNTQHPSQSGAHSLQWDEENLALTEINKDSLMKITEPKTPYVRYNALTDEIEGEIPEFHLSGGYSSLGEQEVGSPIPTSPLAQVHPQAVEESGPSSRRTSISSTGRPGTPKRSASGSSSRSTSFNLPNEARKELRPAGEIEADEVEEEGEMDEETAAKHAAFVRARKGHYSNEAEAMKVSSGFRKWCQSKLKLGFMCSGRRNLWTMKKTTILRR
ncbi:hypothetical protein FA15DRAFT_667935 [Coprinopsis marcescibilis]|uniref:Protein phosphatase inhibitor 2 n=1 Tax=Coprinopsis marcescibilis TaxID=230819 RepID=A0A5C3KZT5_COPMA|nr:hypothetical protein FA15DRAFT_667935 [Coprinopsis marcescibilis]